MAHSVKSADSNMITDKKVVDENDSSLRKGLSVVHSEGMDSETLGKTEFDGNSVVGDP